MGRTAVGGLFRILLIAATCLVAAVTVCGAFAGHYAPAESRWMPLLGMAVPTLLAVNLLVALCWAWARQRWVWIPLLALLANWNYLSAVLQVGWPDRLPAEVTASRPHPMGYLTVATYNVQHFGSEITGYSCRELARYMEQERVDILCFQEFGDNPSFTLDSLKHTLRHWPHAFIMDADSIRGVLPLAVFSRFPLTHTEFITYTGSANCSMQCDLILEEDTVRLLNNHLQTTNVGQKRRKWKRAMVAAQDMRHEAEVMQDAAGTLHDNFMKRAMQTDSICRRIADSPYPVVVCGDFNSLPSSYTYHRLSDLLDDGFRTAGNGYMYTYRYAKRMLRIDYIFHSPALEGVHYYSPDLELCSDHNPVIFTLKL
ncbi:MAG: endonuclease/exonuclease/phosphatase family protein [Bacteroides sp.]|nr:endonuclease/exonuclease/phosphatase family protein [Bacteroides sp.]